MGGIFDEFRHLVADIGDLELYVSLLTKKSATVNIIIYCMAPSMLYIWKASSSFPLSEQIMILI